MNNEALLTTEENVLKLNAAEYEIDWIYQDEQYSMCGIVDKKSDKYHIIDIPKIFPYTKETVIGYLNTENGMKLIETSITK